MKKLTGMDMLSRALNPIKKKSKATRIGKKKKDIKTPKYRMVKEHKHLVKVLSRGKKSELKREEEKQEKELKGYEKKKRKCHKASQYGNVKKRKNIFETTAYKKKRKMTVAQDMAYDKKHNLKEGSKADLKQDRKYGVKQVGQEIKKKRK